MPFSVFPFLSKSSRLKPGEALLKAVTEGDTKQVKRFISRIRLKGDDDNQRLLYECLNAATENNHADVAALLLPHVDYIWNLLLKAVNQNKLELAKLLAPKARLAEAREVLAASIGSDHVEFTKLLIPYADIHSTHNHFTTFMDPSGEVWPVTESFLFQAINASKWECAKVLLPLCKPDGLHVFQAATWGNLELVKELVRQADFSEEEFAALMSKDSWKFTDATCHQFLIDTLRSHLEDAVPLAATSKSKKPSALRL